MITIFIVHLLGQKVTQGAIQTESSKGKNCSGQMINVVSFVNPDNEIGSFKISLDDVSSLAVLAKDSRGALPETFTICSDIMSLLSTAENRLMFFNLLGNNEEQLFAVIAPGGNLYTTWGIIGHIATFFPNQWLRSCMAIDTVSGMINWVVDGDLVANKTIAVLKDSDTSFKLNAKIILGAFQTPSKEWQVYSNKLTNLACSHCQLCKRGEMGMRAVVLMRATIKLGARWNGAYKEGQPLNR